MKLKYNIRLPLALAALALTAGVSSGQGTFTSDYVTAPLFNGADQGFFNLNTPSTAAGEDKWGAENSGAGKPKGQTFTATGDVLVSAITYRLRTTNKPPTVDYLIRLGVIDTASNTFYPLHEENIIQIIDWGIKTGLPLETDNAYGTWTLDAPVTLPALAGGTVYGFDLTMVSSTSGWQSGLAYPLYETADVAAGGAMYTTPLDGAVGVPTNDMTMSNGSDREFHIDMASTTIVDITKPTLLSFDDNVGGGPVYQDQAEITYTLTFDEAVDASLIDITDFVNLGTGVSIDYIGTVTNTPFPVASVVTVQIGISGTGTLQLGVSDTSDIADFYTNTMNSPVNDIDAITVLVGTTPGTGILSWDGSFITRPSNGLSDGGNGTWDTTITNWDKGVGLADQVAWNNANLDTAILGGSTGTATLREDIIVGGLTINSNDYTINTAANTLTFGAPGLINTQTNNSRNDVIKIQGVVAGAAITKTGPGWLLLEGNNTFSSFTLNQGGYGEIGAGTHLGFGAGVVTINGGGFFSTNSATTTFDNDMVWNGNWYAQNVSVSSKVLELNGDITLGGNVTISSKHAMHFNGVISDSGNGYQLSLQDSGGGSNFHLNAANTFGGGVNWKEDNITINNAAGLGSGTFIIQNAASSMDNTSGGPITLSTNNPQEWRGSFSFTGSNDLNLGTGAATMFANHTVTVNAGTLTVGGGLSQSGARALTKNGAGTLVLSGANTYTGNTTVSNGALALVGGSQTSEITVESGASLDLTLGSATSSIKALTLSAGHTIAITGTVDNSSDYLLMMASVITGTPTLAAPITDYELLVLNADTELWLVYTGEANVYVNWAAGPFLSTLTDTSASLDFDGGSLETGIEYVVGGDPTDPIDDTALAPKCGQDETHLIYTYIRTDISNDDANATITAEYSSDLVDWTTAVDSVDSVIISKTDNGATDSVEVKIPMALAIGGKLFARLNVVITPNP